MKKTLAIIIALSIIGVKTIDANPINYTTVSSFVKGKSTNKKVAGPNGKYYCKRSNEYYIFKSNHTGSFVSSGMSSSFTWKLKGSFVIIKYSATSKTELQYNRSSNYLLEDSSLFGTTLVYNKVK